MEKTTYKLLYAGVPVTVEMGGLVQQTNGSALIRYGDTVVLSVAVLGDAPEGRDFFPLTVQYEEKMYAAGKMPGGFIKREGRPSEHATLMARLIDRPLRPLFPDGFFNDVQVINTVLSSDSDHAPELAAILGSSLALGISDIPFDGPIAAVKIGRVAGEFILNPTVVQSKASDLDLTVAGTESAINMVEASSKEVAEADMVHALLFAFKAIQQVCKFQKQIIEAVGKPKIALSPVEEPLELRAQMQTMYEGRLTNALRTPGKLARDSQIQALKSEAYMHFQDQESDNSDIKAQVNSEFERLLQQIVRQMIIQEKLRVDGRKLDEIRPLSAEVGLLPRVHGSAVFSRGETQVLSALTLAPLAESQTIDGLDPESHKRFLHQYNFPAFSVGETGRYGAPGRREIGHGALGEKALQAILPSEAAFPYTIRLVAEVLGSNGSSSQASICAGTLALMDGGVPITAPVAGVAMGLVQENGKTAILTDIQGLEDHLGDMDFKVAGTKRGITAMQMDLKAEGIDESLLLEILNRAKTARLQILDVMTRTLPHYRTHLSPYAPKIVSIQIAPDEIRNVIGKGGETINQIIDKTGVKIDINDDGQVSIASTDQAQIDAAIAWIKDLTMKIEVGHVYMGKVVRIEAFGAFVHLAQGKDALVHISQLADHHIDSVAKEVALGDKILVKVTRIDERGRINASRKALLTENNAANAPKS